MRKNRKYLFSLTFACILLVILCLLISGNIKNNNDYGNKAWMSNISDDKKLSDIMIPGVHNAAASNLPLSLFAKCQKYSISELLNKGYRYLDIRAGVDEVAGERRLVLYHNFVPCYKKDTILPKKLTFDDVLASCYGFLEENPSETIVFMVKYEHGDISTSEFEKLIDISIDKNRDKWLLTDKTPSLKEARGKIVLYRRYKDEALLGSKAGIECTWKVQKDTEISDINSIFASWNGDNSYVQDMYKLASDDKWEAFSYALSKASEKDNTYGNYPTINFLSTAGTGSVGIPIYYASVLNKRFMNYNLNEEICPQWIIVDFGNDKLADKIIKANF